MKRLEFRERRMKYRRIAVKVGSNVLTRKDGTLDLTRMSALVDQIADLRHSGIEVILISSGAVASGRSELQLPSTETERMDSVEQRQLFSAVGQAKLMGRYVEMFRDHGLHVGQVLTMKENFATPRQNENDTVCVTELMFTDNDELSGLVARLMDCQALIILSNVDGLYDGHPAKPGSRIISEVRPGEDLSAFISTSQSAEGRGGMQSKYHTATEVAAQGIDVFIANGKREQVLYELMNDPGQVPHTHFLALNNSYNI